MSFMEPDGPQTEPPLWSTPCEFCRSVQVLTDIPGFVENYIVKIKGLKLKLVD